MIIRSGKSPVHFSFGPHQLNKLEAEKFELTGSILSMDVNHLRVRGDLSDGDFELLTKNHGPLKVVMITDRGLWEKIFKHSPTITEVIVKTSAGPLHRMQVTAVDDDAFRFLG